MRIRKTVAADLDAVMRIYAEARAFMCENGNPDQWKDGYPLREWIEDDIEGHKSYVCVDNAGIVLAVFYFAVEREAVYDTLEGKWIAGDDNPNGGNGDTYGVIHRIAKGANTPRGVGRFCIDWCFEQCGNVKIDTHEANAPMLRLLENIGFVYCGIVRYLIDGGERVAFQKRRKEQGNSL